MIRTALRFLALAAGLIWSACAFAQSGPGFTFTYGYVPTVGQWQTAFTSKQDYLGAAPLLTTGGTMVGALITAASTTTAAGLNLPPGVAPTSPNNGDIWTTGVGLYVRINGVTIGPLTEGTAGSFTGTSPIVASFSAGVVDYAFNFSVANTFLAQQTDQGATTTSPGWYAQIAGDAMARVRVGLNGTDVASLAFGPGNVARDTFLERAGPATFRFGAPNAAAPTAQTLGVQNVVAGTSNTAGAALTIDGSIGTGSAIGGGIFFKVAPAGSSGTAQNSFVTALSIFGDGGLSTGAAADEGLGTLNLTGALYNNGTGPTGTGGYVRATSPSLVTPSLGVAGATSLAVDGCTIGASSFCVTGSTALAATTVTGSFTATGLVTLGDLATQLANTLLGNATSGAASPTALAMPTSGTSGCAGAGNALAYQTNVGFTCNTSITAAVAPISGLTGAGTGVLASLGIALNASGGIPSPTPALAGDIMYWTGTAWASLAGNNSGTQALFENASGVPSWAPAVGSGTVTSVATDTTLTGGPCTTTCTLGINGAVAPVHGGSGVASPTAHTVPINEGASAQNNTGTGTLGQALVSGGGSADPSYKSGVKVLLNTLTPSGVVNISDTTSFTSAYNEYEIVFENVRPASGSSLSCEIQVYSGGSFQSSGYLATSTFATTSVVAAAGSTTFIPCSGVGRSAIGQGVSGTMQLYGPVSASSVGKQWVTNYIYTGASTIESGSGGGYWNNGAALDGVLFSFGGGVNFSGTIKIYGIL